MRRLATGALTFGLLAAAAWVSWEVGRGHRGAGVGSGPSPTPSPAAALAPEAPEIHRELLPAHRSGERVVVDLVEPPAARYGGTEMTEADRVYAREVAAAGRPEALYDAALGHAARELAYQHSLLGTLLPQDIVDFLMVSAGAIDRSVTQGFTATGGDDMDAVRARLQGLLDGIAPDGHVVRVGIGEAYVPGATRPRYIAILVSRRRVEISPAARRIHPGGTWVLSGTLPLGYEQPSALVLRPSGLLESLDIRSAGRRFSLRVPAGDEVGTLQVSVGATGPYGPGPLLQLPVEVGQDPPKTFQTVMPPDESGIASVQHGEALAWRLLNQDRERFGLPALPRDPELDAVARAHCVDMREHHWFGHHSEETGGPGDRLAAAGYRAATYAENVAQGGSIHGAEEGLLHSLGHRRNILSSRFTRVGIGMAARRREGRTTWYLTQLFARPVPRVEGERAVAGLARRLDALRRRSGRPALRSDGRLARIATAAAGPAAAGGTEGLAQSTLGQAEREGLTRGGAYIWIQSTTDLDALELPSQAGSADYVRVGIGVVQLPDHPNGLVGVVLLLAGPER